MWARYLPQPRVLCLPELAAAELTWNPCGCKTFFKTALHPTREIVHAAHGMCGGHQCVHSSGLIPQCGSLADSHCAAVGLRPQRALIASVPILPCRSWAWLPPSVRRLTFTHCPPADCPTLACVEEVQVEHLQDCTALDVTKFPSARVLKASFTDASQWELMKVPTADIPTTKVPWLEQLAALPQLARVEFTCFEFSPRNILAQLPAGCELVIHTDIRETLEDSLPRRASLPHLVSLHATISVPTYLPDVEFSCLAGCPNLREVQLSIDDYCGNCDFTDPTWVDLSTLKYLPTRCSTGV